MIIWDWGRPRTIQGYWDMGGIKIPPIPKPIILTDRADGTLWWLSFSTASPGPDGLGYVSLNSQIPTDPNRIIYDVNEGPIVGSNPRIRLIVRGGYLGYELFPAQRGITAGSQERVLAQKTGVQREYREIILPTGWTDQDRGFVSITELGWTQVLFP